MSSPVRAPRLGQSATEVEIIRWLLPPGAEVSAGDPVVLVETDKTEIEVVAAEPGVLGPPLVEAGEVAAVGSVLAEVLGPDDVATHAPAHRPYASPKARRLAAEAVVDLRSLSGSGPGGLIVASDVAGVADLAEATTESRSRVPIARRLTRGWSETCLLYTSPSPRDED